MTGIPMASGLVWAAVTLRVAGADNKQQSIGSALLKLLVAHYFSAGRTGSMHVMPPGCRNNEQNQCQTQWHTTCLLMNLVY
jgi:hypothetical protein